MSTVHTLALPAKLDDEYPCGGTDANDEQFRFKDLLEVGERVGTTADDKGNVWGPFGIVVKRDDGLWIVADPLDLARREDSQP